MVFVAFCYHSGLRLAQQQPSDYHTPTVLNECGKNIAHKLSNRVIVFPIATWWRACVGALQPFR